MHTCHFANDERLWNMTFDGRLMSGVGVLAAIVETGNFVRAADALGMTQPGVSRALARIEARLGVRLLERTSRNVRLTDEGRRFYNQVGPLLTIIEDAAIQASDSAATVRGRLKVNIDPFFAHANLAPRLNDLLARYLSLEMEVVTSETMGDLVAEGFDLAIRFGQPEDSALIARKLFDTRILTVAAPDYLERHGRPTHPLDLADARHEVIRFRDPYSGKLFEWEFLRGEEVLPVHVHGRLTVTGLDMLISACVSGRGVGRIRALGIQDMLHDGRLVELFPDWQDERLVLYAYHPTRAVSRKVRALIEFITESNWDDY
jgi:DNA-binding transcriptional LysR family regulator